VQYQLITAWEELQDHLKQLPKTGIRVLEVKTNRKRDVIWRRENLPMFAKIRYPTS
jgi:2-succinyl-5-enolpyruvyl-6-hydroxy-3-cyclohexene-1-carboxylate synthase